jgi:hypothetical protein
MCQERKYQRRQRLVILILAYIALMTATVLGQESNGDAGIFLRMGAGARPMGLGGTYVGLAEGPAASYWNPSGLGRIQNFQFEFMNTNLPFERTFNFFSGALPIRNVATLGISWIGLRVSGIESRSGPTSDPDFTFGSSQNMFAFSLGKSVASLFSIGGTVKFIKFDLGGESATGLGFDAGLLIHPFDRFGIGVMAQDIGTDYRWDGGLTEGVPSTYRLGLSFKAFEGVVLVADVNKTGDLSPRLHFGGELRPAYFLPIRIGYHDKQISGGAGFMVPLAAHSLELNYSLTNDRIFNEAIHQVSVVFSFGSHSARASKPTKTRPAPRPDYNTVTSPPRNTVTKAEKKTTSATVTAALLNVRSGPGTKFRKVTQIRNGQKFEVVAEAGQWVKIKVRSGAGWVHRNYVNISE